VIEEENRVAILIECGTSIPYARLLKTMNQLIEGYSARMSIRLYKSSEVASEMFIEWAKKFGIELLFIQPGMPNQNAFLKVSPEASVMKFSMPICLMPSQRVKSPLMFG
jgi:putative transposase